MKLLIAYASHTGTAEECANTLSQRLAALSPTVLSLEKEIPDVTEYDIVILGSSIRFGKLHPAARRFLKSEEKKLSERSFGFFLCCAFSHDFERYCENLLPRKLREHAFETLYFGGTLRREHLNWRERLLVRAMRSYLVESDIEDGEYTPTLPSLLPENIDVMAAAIRKEFARLRK